MKASRASLLLHSFCSLGDSINLAEETSGLFLPCRQLTTTMSNVLAKDEGGLRATDMRTIIEMMGPSDLSELEDEVKVIQTNVRAWILRCNYKSLRKAARTLQVRFYSASGARSASRLHLDAGEVSECLAEISMHAKSLHDPLVFFRNVSRSNASAPPV